jgi:hypothetical protein
LDGPQLIIESDTAAKINTPEVAFIAERQLGFQLRVWTNSVTYLQTPHLPPSLAQCRQYLQFLQALQGSEPVHVAEENMSSGIKVRRLSERSVRETKDNTLFVVIRRPSFHRYGKDFNRG